MRAGRSVQDGVSQRLIGDAPSDLQAHVTTLYHSYTNTHAGVRSVATADNPKLPDQSAEKRMGGDEDLWALPAAME